MMTVDVTQSRQALLLAIAIEKSNAAWFHHCAIRFLPYDPQLSTLLEQLSREEDEHHEELVELYRSSFDEMPDEEMSPPDQLQRYQNGLRHIKKHFFVVNKLMADSILEKALEIERYTRQYYTELTGMVADPEAAEVYQRLSKYEQEHERLFMERLRKG